MATLNYLNVGCGSKYHPDWVNIDMVSNSPHVVSVNLLNGIPYPDNQFDIVYHSQVLEHIPKSNAPAFIRECYRVLKPGGVLRVVVPDLENIVDEYKKHLTENLHKPTEQSAAKYDWIMLELYDQTVRNYPGGQMAEFFQRPVIPSEQYVMDRVGYVGRSIRDSYAQATATAKQVLPYSKRLKRFLRRSYFQLKQGLTTQSEATALGRFRLGGEIHMWMYDRYSLARLLTACGFVHSTVETPFTSHIPDWARYELDVKDGLVYDPVSLFMEARKEAIGQRTES